MKTTLLMVLALALGACSLPFGGGNDRVETVHGGGVLPRGENGGERKIGKPYKVAGRWYTPKEDPGYDRVGYASWYGRKFHGKRTANGEIYDMNQLTAAHKTLPLPSFVKVTNLENGRSLILRVNDRGPFVGDRIIDISRRGAQLLGFEKQGVTKVRVQIADPDGGIRNKPRIARQQVEPRAVDTAEATFVQVGAFADQANARARVQALARQGIKASVQRAKTARGLFYRVRLGPFARRNQAEDMLDRVMNGGFYEARIFTEASR
ncbi:septal ring lytic transglycosylase RlpA family protein [Yunchengibacter salinarum]|uniref:septal ring lytic transglycosylase RlpA family protein n=1 Tax=Yunchengibacter salinarum TaxID=3133399 RepID=UPI0035B666F0